MTNNRTIRRTTADKDGRREIDAQLPVRWAPRQE
jgi:hypothetical protein